MSYNAEYYQKNKEKLKAAARANYYKNQEAAKARGRRWYHENKDRARVSNRRWYQENRERVLERERESSKKTAITRHGITVEEFNDLLLEQNGVCAICESECSVAPRLSADHDHETGRVRGLLCKTCNSGLGFFKDSPGLLSAATDYLTAHV